MNEAAKPDSLRLFIAIELPDDVKDAIQRAQDRMKEAVSSGRIRWTKREQLHITLKFLGNIPARDLEELKRGLTGACSACPPFALLAEGVGFFPGPQSPRVIWAGVRAIQGQLELLHQSIEDAAKRFVSEADGQAFSGHITMGRVKYLPGREARLLGSLATDMQNERFGEWTADKAVLLASELHPDGSRYTTVAPLPFGRSADIAVRSNAQSRT